MNIYILYSSVAAKILHYGKRSSSDVELSSAAVGADQHHKNQAELACYALKVLETRFSVSALDTLLPTHPSSSSSTKVILLSVVVESLDNSQDKKRGHIRAGS